MTYTNPERIRHLSNLTTSDISDAYLFEMIYESTKEINSKINVEVIREKIEYIDLTRQNKIDGSNTTYYVKNWKGKYLADRNSDGSIDTSDITVYAVDNDGTETVATVSSIDFDDGSFVLSTAYDSSYLLYVSYEWSYYDQSTPTALLGLAATYLAIAYAYLKRDSGAPNVRFGNVTINRKVSENYSLFYNRYLELMKDLNSGGILKGSWKESTVKI